MRAVAPLVLLLLAPLPAHPADPIDESLVLDGGASRLVWLGPEGVEWAASLDPADGHAVDGTPVPLAGRRWHPTQVDVEVPLLGGGSFPLAEAKGRVLVLEFWASWCAPCWETLPAIQRLHDEQGDRGLVVLAVNAKESAEVAKSTAEALELTVPIGSYTDEIHQLFRVSTLPTAIVADRRGRVRGRWNRHQMGGVNEMTELIGSLLDEEGEEEPDPPVAEVIRGDGLLRVAWVRRAPASPRGLLVAPGGPGGEQGILAAAGESLLLYGRDGRTLGDWSVPSAVGALRLGEAREDGVFPVAGFRPGGRETIVIEMPAGDLKRLEAPAPVFDAALVKAEDSSWDVVAGTNESLVRLAAGRSVETRGDHGLISSLAWSGPRSEGRLVALSVGTQGPSRLIWLDPALEETASVKGPGDAWSLITDPARPGRVGVAPAVVTAAAVGRFAGGRSTQAAVATRSGLLVLLELETGNELFRASWSEGHVSHLAAGDLDGDGMDELAVAAGSELVLLTVDD